MCGIYKITNLANGKCYVGQSINIIRRWNDHKRVAFDNSNKNYEYPLYRAIREYGINNFEFSILEECTPEELDDKEVYYISLYDSYSNGYNQTSGGQSNFSFAWKLTEDEVFEIYDLLANSDWTQREIAETYGVGQDVISRINQGKSRYHSGYTYPIRVNHFEKNYCACGKEITRMSTQCIECYRNSRKPSKETLEQALVSYTGNFNKVGETFEVSCTTIKRWAVSYKLSTKARDYQVPKIKKIKQPTTPCKKVAKLDKNTDEVLEVYSSIYQAEKENGNPTHISDVCNGKRKTCIGYKWKFIE